MPQFTANAAATAVLAAAWLMLLADIGSAQSTAMPITFGNGLASFQICNAPTELLTYNLSAMAAFGVMSHFWTTGDTDTITVEYYIDGESTPSIAFQPALAAGQGFPAEMAQDPISTGGLFAAGATMGKAAPVGGWYLYHKIPFYSSVRIITRTSVPGQCVNAYMIVRGYEALQGTDLASGIRLPSGFQLPVGTRLQLQRLESEVFPPLWFVSVANVSFGYAGLMLQSTMAIQTVPAANNYIEGCWHLFNSGNTSFPGTIVGTGFEDFYDSAYWFGAASGYPNTGVPFQHPSSGLLHFSRGAAGQGGPNNTEQLSMYRLFEHEVFGFQDGGRLVWRVGDQTSKCGSNGTDSPIGTPSAVNLTSYSWIYTWPNGLPIAPLEPLPNSHMSYTCSGSQCVPVPDPSGQYWNADCDDACGNAPIPSPSPGPPAIVGCSDGQCDAFCDTGVHGCAVTWTGSMSLRTSPTGKPCGTGIGPCESPADACAPGWALCLSNFSAPGLSSNGFRDSIDADGCANGDPRRFVAAMSHANPAWSNLPPAPCPPSPQTVDNGCNADGWGAEPVCCGAGCSVPSCPNDLWMGGTRIHIGEGEGCGSIDGSSGFVDGVLCCKV